MNQGIFQNLESEIHVWWSMLDQPQNSVNQYYRMLSCEEQKRINRFRFPLVRDRQIVSRGILKQLISKYIGRSLKEVQFTYNKYGKPLLFSKLDECDLYFNMSHSEYMGIFGFAKSEAIGVDVEKIKELHNLEDIIQLCFSDFEQSWFNGVPTKMRTEVFYKVWTAKEAFTKAIGTGFSFPLKKIIFKYDSENNLSFHNISDDGDLLENWDIITFKPHPNFMASLVMKTNGLKVKKRPWEIGFE